MKYNGTTLLGPYSNIDLETKELFSRFIKAFELGRELGKKYLTSADIMELSRVFIKGREIKDYADTYPLVYFPLTSDRFILTYWLLDAVVNDEGGTDSIDEVYRGLRQKYASKAFSRTRLTRLLGNHKTIDRRQVTALLSISLRIKDFIVRGEPLPDAPDELILQGIGDVDTNSTGNKTPILRDQIMTPASLGYLLNNVIKNGRNRTILIRRVKGDVFSDVALDLSISPERVRQLEKKSLKRLGTSLNGELGKCLREFYSSSEGMLDREAIIQNTSEDDWDIIVYAINTVKPDDWFYLDSIGLVIYGLNEAAKKEFLRKPQELPNTIDGAFIASWAESLKSVGLVSNPEGLIRSHLNGIGYKLNGDYLSYKTVSIKEAAKRVMGELKEEVFSLNDPKDTARLRKMLKEKGADVSDSDKSLWSAIAGSMVLCGRGQYCSPHRIKVDKKLLDDVVNYARSSGAKGISYLNLFEHFKDGLSRDSNIDNHNYLHGVLMYLYPSAFRYKRGYLLAASKEDGAVSSPRMIERYLREAEGKVTREELNSSFNTLSNVQIQYAQKNYPEIILWDDNTYLHANKLKLEEQDRDTFRGWLERDFETNEGYSSSHRLLNRMTADNTGIMERLGVLTDHNAFKVAEYLLKGEYAFSYPHIIKDWNPEKRFTTEDLITMSNKNIKRFNRTELERRVIDMVGKSIPSLAYAMRDYCDKYIRIDKDLFVEPSVIGINDVIIKKVDGALKKHFSKAEVLVPSEDKKWHGSLPVLEVPWNPYILGSIILLYLPSYKVIGKSLRPGAVYSFALDKSIIDRLEDV